jgi:drug/metabolite transporter (DMT)-like permease
MHAKVPIMNLQIFFWMHDLQDLEGLDIAAVLVTGSLPVGRAMCLANGLMRKVPAVRQVGLVTGPGVRTSGCYNFPYLAT